jgi:hypothetical protein
MHALRSQRFYNGTSLAESSSGLRALAAQPLKSRISLRSSHENAKSGLDFGIVVGL